MLQIIVGIIFTYLLLSLLATTINELLASWRGWRGYFLDEGLQKMLEKNENEQAYRAFTRNPLYKQLRKHPLIMRISRAPSYLNNHTFSSILLTVLREKYRNSLTLDDFIHALPDGSPLKAALEEAESKGNEVANTLKTLIIKAKSKEEAYNNLNAYIAKLPEGSTSRRALEIIKSKGDRVFDHLDLIQNLLHAENVEGMLDALPKDSKLERILRQLKEETTGEIHEFKAKVNNWFDEVMDRSAGWYKRHMQMITFLVGLTIAASLNADTFKIYRHLSTNSDARQKVAELATDFVSKNETLPEIDATNARKMQKEISAMLTEDVGKLRNPLGLGWEFEEVNGVKIIQGDNPDDPLGSWAMRFLGWIITALAISLGAPFWFDVLKRMVNIKGAGREAQSAPTQVIVQTNK
ncbi:MAG: hypothetical protein D6714_10020 [Bacteroidetes bacterium]|nr:MAG: hypothetical protein D6714_10020 [Bacteroidota bacterium]